MHQVTKWRNLAAISWTGERSLASDSTNTLDSARREYHTLKTHPRYHKGSTLKIFFEICKKYIRFHKKNINV